MLVLRDIPQCCSMLKLRPRRHPAVLQHAVSDVDAGEQYFLSPPMAAPAIAPLDAPAAFQGAASFLAVVEGGAGF